MPKSQIIKTPFWWILALILLLPVLFFGTIRVFQMNGLPVYFAQLGLYALFFILAWWGIKKDELTVSVNWKTLVSAVFFTTLAWIAYALIFCAIFQVRWSDQMVDLSLIPAWKIAANILSTWIFVGFAEELLFRVYFLTRIKHFFERRNLPRVSLLAILCSSLLFAVWHFPVRLFEMANGESSWALILLSMLVLFVIGIGFAWLFVRTNNILLVGLVHGLMDYPLIGEDSQLSFVILIVAIILVEINQLRNRRTPDIPEEEDF